MEKATKQHTKLLKHQKARICNSLHAFYTPVNGYKETIQALFNLIEAQASTIRKLQEENQQLRDEINRLKGEQGKPKIKPDNKTKAQDISSEKERKEDTPESGRSSVKDKITINRTQICKVNKAQLPDDAVFKGHETVTVQDLRIETDNVKFNQEKHDIMEAGLISTPYQQIDDTSARVNGQNYYTHILCNP